MISIRGHQETGGSTISLRLVSPTDTVTLASLTQPGSREMLDFKCVKLSGQPPIFSPDISFSWAGGKIAISRGAEYQIALFRGGRLERLLRRDVAAVPATLEAVRRLYPEGMSIRFGFGGSPPCVISAGDLAAQLGIAPVVPAIADLRESPDGFLWVARTTFTDEPTRYDVFDPQGSYLGTATTAGAVAGFASSGLVVMVVPDSSTGGHQLGGYRIVR